MVNKREKDEQVHFTYENESRKIKIDRASFGTETQEIKLTKKNSGIQKKFFIGLIAVAVVAIISVIVIESVNRKNNTIEITEEHVMVKYYELPGNIYVDAYINTTYVYERAKEILSKRPEAKNDPDYVESNAIDLLDAFSVEIENEDGLYIGDIATVIVTPNKKILDKKGVYGKGGIFKIKVEGYVAEMEDDVTLNIWPNVKVYEIDLGDEIQYRAYYFNDDEFVYLNENDFEYYIEENDEEKNIRIKITDECRTQQYWSSINFEPLEYVFAEKDIVFKNIFDYDQLNKDMVQKLEDKISQEIKNKYSEYNEAFVVDSVEYYGGWIATYGTENLVNEFARVYKIQVSHKENYFEPIELYIKYEMVDAVVDPIKNEVSEISSFSDMTPLFDNISYVIDLNEESVLVAGCKDIDRVLKREKVPTGNGSIVFDPNGNIHGFLD